MPYYPWLRDQRILGYHGFAIAFCEWNPDIQLLRITQSGTVTPLSDGPVGTPGATFEWPANIWVDYGTSITYDQYLLGAATNTRYASSTGTNFTSGAVTVAGSQYTNHMYEQLSNTYAANPDIPTTFSGSITFAVTGTSLGTSGQPVCTISVPGSPAPATSYSCTGYADNDTGTGLPLYSTNNPANTRWASTGTIIYVDT